MNIPTENPGDILSMAWDPTLRTLYLPLVANSGHGDISPHRDRAPRRCLREQACSTSFSSISGHVWGGTFPLGAVFRFTPAHRRSRCSRGLPRIHSTSAASAWTSTGASGQVRGLRNPRLFTFLRTSPEVREEIAHPDPIENGFITAVRAGPTKVLITSAPHDPDIFELDATTRTWDRRVDAKGWVRPPAASILRMTLSTRSKARSWPPYLLGDRNAREGLKSTDAIFDPCVRR